MRKLTICLMAISLITVHSALSQTCVPVCDAVGQSTAFEWIQGISIGSLTNISGNNNGYEDFGNTGATFNAGTSISYTLGAGYGQGPFSESWKAWMDLNHDGDFDDEGEEIFTNFGQFQVSGSFFLPNTAMNGPTKLRIAMSFAEPEVCNNLNEGEIEDYCVNVVGGQSPCDPAAVPGFLYTDVQLDQNRVLFSWAHVQGAEVCQLRGGPLGDFNSKITIPTTEFDFIYVPLNKFSPGDWNWKVQCACSLSPLVPTQESIIQFFTIPEPESAGISSYEGWATQSSLTIYPNPVNDILNVSLNAGGHGKAQLILSDILGRIVIEKDIDVSYSQNNFTLDLSSLPVGTYNATVIDAANGRTSQKLIKQ